MLIASIGSWANSTSAISYTLRGQTKEPELRPHKPYQMWIMGLEYQKVAQLCNGCSIAQGNLMSLICKQTQAYMVSRLFFLAAWKTERVKAVLRTVP